MKLNCRTIASLLSVGCVLWGAYCAIVLIGFGFPLPGVVLFAPGYLVTAGYLYRLLGRPGPSAKQRIWTLSTFVQSAWLMAAMLNRPLPKGIFDGAVYFWWLSSIALSAYCFKYDANGEGFVEPKTES